MHKKHVKIGVKWLSGEHCMHVPLSGMIFKGSSIRILAQGVLKVVLSKGAPMSSESASLMYPYSAKSSL